MRELLEKWADSGDTATQAFGDHFTAPVIQHRRCYLHSPGEPDGYCVVHGGNWHGWRVNPDRPVDHAHILAATIEAIEARGWYWSVQSQGSSSHRFYTVMVEDSVWHGEFDEPVTKPLLTAYLAAIEAEGAS